MTYIASVDRSSYPAHVHKKFSNKSAAIGWARAQGGYNAVVYERRGWATVWARGTGE